MKGFNFEISDILSICEALANASKESSEEHRKLGHKESEAFFEGASSAYANIANLIEKYKIELYEAANLKTHTLIITRK